ncbi:MAG: trypsin-like peptidase domain-containing protein [Nitrososphaeraceae archaeon]
MSNQESQFISVSQGTSIFPSNEVASNNPLSLLFDRLSNSTVQIISTAPMNAFNPNSPNTTEIGAGFVYDTQGHIVTGNHVLGGATIVDVVLRNGDIYTADVVGNDPYTDLAVLRIEGISNSTNDKTTTGILPDSTVSTVPDLPHVVGSQQQQQQLQTSQQELPPPILTPIPVGNSSEVQIGDQVVTIG